MSNKVITIYGKDKKEIAIFKKPTVTKLVVRKGKEGVAK